MSLGKLARGCSPPEASGVDRSPLCKRGVDAWGILCGLGIIPTRVRPSIALLVLAPAELNTIEVRAMVELANGNLSGAQAVIRRAPSQVATPDLVAFFASYWDLGWVLDDAQKRVLFSLGPAAFDDNRAAWALALADAHAFSGDIQRARVFADSANQDFEHRLRSSPNDPLSRALHGVSLAYLGRRADAVREGERAKALLPISKEAQFGPYIQHQLARIYVMVGEPEKALDQLEPLLKIPTICYPVGCASIPLSLRCAVIPALSALLAPNKRRAHRSRELAFLKRHCRG